ncbi:hypothetical protein ILUMI_20349 [Ignelater luminosus]|uniref:Uncharacterized protein n=1 Tax=Ignelater luminosus TaxID=2038154 RepID=A0A8K0G4N1_IGNLU|nr:hypothetical protein ILUMI_20349 [Ignelater luminosus]
MMVATPVLPSPGDWGEKEKVESGWKTSWATLPKASNKFKKPSCHLTIKPDDIRKRTQRPEEKLIVSVCKVQSLFKKLSSHLTEKEQVDSIQRNLLPYLLQNMKSIGKLLMYEKVIKECYWRGRQYAFPPSNTKPIQEPELAYRCM